MLTVGTGGGCGIRKLGTCVKLGIGGGKGIGTTGHGVVGILECQKWECMVAGEKSALPLFEGPNGNGSSDSVDADFP